MAAKKKEKTQLELLEHMKRYGDPQTLPRTGRQVHLRTVNTKELLADDKLPDILTPLIVKSVYMDLTDNELRQFVEQQKGSKKEALDLLDSIDYVVTKTIVSGAKLDDLTLAEKRWVFRLVMGPAELLINFRLDEESDVEPVDEGEDVPQATQ